jgi:hypothetical protein
MLGDECLYGAVRYKAASAKSDGSKLASMDVRVELCFADAQQLASFGNSQQLVCGVGRYAEVDC